MTEKEIKQAQEQQQITFAEVLKHVEEIADETNKQYAEELLQARKFAARQQLTQYLNAHPYATEEEAKAFVDDFMEQTPTELQRSLRIYVNTFGTLFNLQNQLLTTVEDFKQLYIAANRQKLEVAATKILKEQAKAEAKTEAPQQ